jgi:glutamate carboxypeptidase
VPARCEVHVDLRSPEAKTLDAAAAEIERICRDEVVPDVKTVVHTNGWHRPMEKGEGGARLVEIAVQAAAELGFEVRDAATGGASDANTTSAAGTPTIDGLGPVGGDDHAPGEWIDLTSIVPRVSLLAGIVTRL